MNDPNDGLLAEPDEVWLSPEGFLLAPASGNEKSRQQIGGSVEVHHSFEPRQRRKPGRPKPR